MNRPRLVLATANAHKVAEIGRMLGGFPLEVDTLANHPGVSPGPETADTFEGNARLKAEAVCAATGSWALADDSGLEVDALDGRPGVYSKRYAGPDANDADNNRKLLAELSGVPAERRGARFVTVMALARPGLATIAVRGEVLGRILEAARGAGGFGYDPLFYYRPFERSFAELDPDEKNAVSHRAAALTLMREKIGEILNGEPAACAHPAGWTTPVHPGEIPLAAPAPDLLDREAARRRGKVRERVRTLEYLEAVVIALVMALILREFFFEAFKIPTPSMAPTLRGAQRLGDRILVDKLVYRLREPRRWEVVVFRYPLDQSVNYIKRLVGLPGETLRILDGDVWIDGKIARKPDGLQDGLWIPLHPLSRDPMGLQNGDYQPPGRFETKINSPLAGAAWTAPAAGDQVARLRYVFRPEAPAHLYRGVTRRYEAPAPEPGRSIRDLRFRGTLQLDGAHSEAAVRLTTRNIPFTIRFAAGAPGARVEFPGEGTDRPLDWPLEQKDAPGWGRLLTAGIDHEVDVAYFDHQLVVKVNSETWFRYVFAPRPESRWTRLDATTLTLELRRGGQWRDPAVFRDIDHTRHGYVRTLPADSFFVLGDNSTDSKDSRRWRMGVRRRKDGRTVEFDSENGSSHFFHGHYQGATTDVLGNRVPAEELDLEQPAQYREAPFVARDLLIGRAFLIFFPWPPFYTEDFRPGLIR